LHELLGLPQKLKISVRIDDQRTDGRSLHLPFRGELSRLQMESAEILLKHETGVLAAAWLIARRQVSTLVLVRSIGWKAFSDLRQR
jgi:hypothetical protein